MTQRNDGGPAFPVEIDGEGEGKQTGPFSAMATGMTLRDYFAAKAMQGFLAARESCHAGEDGDKIVAQDAYTVADAMLAEREREEP